MKKVFLGVWICIGIFVGSCSKETTENKIVESSETISSLTNDPDPILLDAPTTDAAEALKRVLMANDFNALILSEANNNTDRETTISNLMEKNTNFRNAYLAKLAEVTNGGNYSTLLSRMILAGVAYYPTLLVINANTANSLNKPIVAIGRDNEAYEDDQIKAWQINGVNSFTEFMLTEKQATETANPVFIVTNGTDHVEEIEEGSGISVGDNNNATDILYHKSSMVLKCIAYQVKNGYRYENGQNTKTELCQQSYYYRAVVNGSGDYNSGQGDIARIPRSGVNGSQFWTGQNIPLVGQQNIEEFPMYWIVAFEQDWYASKKTVRHCSFGNILQARPKMSQSYEWYTSIETCNLNVLTRFPLVSSPPLTVENQKCRIDISRQQ